MLSRNPVLGASAAPRRHRGAWALRASILTCLDARAHTPAYEAVAGVSSMVEQKLPKLTTRVDPFTRSKLS